MPDTRGLTIAYAGTSLGGSNENYLLHDPYRIDLGYERASIVFQVCVVSTTAADFATKCDGLEDLFRTINGALTVTLNGQTMISWSHASNTGFLARPTIRKIGDRNDTGYARFYECSVTVTMPADASGKDGLRAATIDVATEATGRKAYTIRGQYTAIGGSSASAQHAASIAALQSAVESAETGNWKRGPTTTQRDDENKLVSFTASGVQRIFTDAASLLANAAVKTHEMVVTRMREAPGDAGNGNGNASRPLVVGVFFAADIDKSVTQDLRGFYEGTVLPALVAHVRTVCPSGSLAVVREDPEFDSPGNRLRVRLEISLATGGDFLAHTVTTTDDEQEGVTLWPVWDGSPYGAKLMPAKRIWTRTIEEAALTLSGGGSRGRALAVGNPTGGSIGGPNLFSGGDRPGGSISGGSNLFTALGQAAGQSPNAGASGEGGSFVTLRKITSTTPQTVGIPGYQMAVTAQRFVYAMQRWTAPRGGSGSGGSDASTSGGAA